MTYFMYKHFTIIIYIMEQHTRGVGDALEKHHNISPDCAILTLNSSLYLDYFAHLIKQTFTKRLLYAVP